jgi:hypothetical protein
MKWFDADIGSVQAALQKTPEVLQSVRVNLPIHILLGMVDNLMGKVLFQALIRFQRITVEIRSSLKEVGKT